MKMDERDLDHFFRLDYRQLCIYALHFVEKQLLRMPVQLKI